jgi:hypothetical protein
VHACEKQKGRKQGLPTCSRTGQQARALPRRARDPGAQERQLPNAAGASTALRLSCGLVGRPTHRVSTSGPIIFSPEPDRPTAECPMSPSAASPSLHRPIAIHDRQSCQPVTTAFIEPIVLLLFIYLWLLGQLLSFCAAFRPRFPSTNIL